MDAYVGGVRVRVRVLWATGVILSLVCIQVGVVGVAGVAGPASMAAAPVLGDKVVLHAATS